MKVEICGFLRTYSFENFFCIMTFSGNASQKFLSLSSVFVFKLSRLVQFHDTKRRLMKDIAFKNELDLKPSKQRGTNDHADENHQELPQ
jgi:hypothetical protein